MNGIGGRERRRQLVAYLRLGRVLLKSYDDARSGDKAGRETNTFNKLNGFPLFPLAQRIDPQHR